MGIDRRLNVVINARVNPVTDGGIVQSTAGLIWGLGQLDGNSEQYTILYKTQEQYDWLRNVCAPHQHLVRVPDHFDGPGQKPAFSLARILKAALGPLLPAARYVQRLVNIQRQWPEVRLSDGFIESLGCDLVHFPTQSFVVCSLPSVYNPHDLQHLHYPQFFAREEIVAREVTYRAGCQLAKSVVVGTQWVKDDLIRQYRIDPDKIQIIPWASPTTFYKSASALQMRTVLDKYSLAQPFALYPAVTWPHKNHVRLLESLAFLRDRRGLRVTVVCTGTRYRPHWPTIESTVRQLQLESQVHFLGFVPEEDLRALYRHAQFLVLPTLYEADSCPVHEAWSEGLPVTSSNVTALPDQILDAGLLFDPTSIESIAQAIERMATSEQLRDELRKRGYLRMKDFDWLRTAKAYRAVYRRAADRPLTEEDQWLLQWDWMRHPHRKQPQTPSVVAAL